MYLSVALLRDDIRLIGLANRRDWVNCNLLNVDRTPLAHSFWYFMLHGLDEIRSDLPQPGMEGGDLLDVGDNISVTVFVQVENHSLMDRIKLLWFNEK